MIPFLVSAWLSGCASRPTVSQDQLVDVSPEVVERVRVMRAEERRLSDQIASAEARLEQSRNRESDEQARLDAQNDALREIERLKKLAVQRADPDSALRADQNLADRQALVEEVQAAHDAAVAERRRADAALQVLRAQKAVTEAQIELTQARAVSADNVDRFERAVVAAQAALDAAKRQEAYVESDTQQHMDIQNQEIPEDSPRESPEMEDPPPETPEMGTPPPAPEPEQDPPPGPEDQPPG